MPSIPILIYTSLVVLVAGVVRGYSGFGFSMITVISLTLVLAPARVVPSVLLLEIAASAWLLPGAWRHIDWPRLWWLGIGVLLGTPIGVYALASIPERPMRAAISLVVLTLVILLLRGFSLKKMPGARITTATGFSSGVLNGAAAVGGPPLILFYLSSPAGAAASRATMIAYFFGTDIWGTMVCAAQGLVDRETIVLTACWLPALFVGLTLGGKAFGQSNDRSFRQKVLIILALLSLAGLIRAVIS